VGVYPGEVGYKKAALDDAGVPGAPCRLMSLPPATLDETLGYVGHLSHFIRLLTKTSKTMGEERASVWRQVDTAVIFCSEDFMMSEPCLTMLERCAPTLRSLGVRDNTRGYRRTSSARYRRTVPLNVLLTRTAALRRLSVRNSNEYLPALPIGEGALPALEWLGKYVREAAVELSEILSLSF